MSDSIAFAWAIMFASLKDKMCVDTEFLTTLWGYVKDLCGSIDEGRVSVTDIMVALKEEDGIELV